MQKKMYRVELIVALGLLMALFACSKERPVEFAQGQGTNLQSVKDFNGKTFTLETGGEVGSANISSAAALHVGESARGVNNFPVVAYKSDAKLLGDLPIRARPNKKYEIRYVATSNYLKVMLVGAKEDLPYDELSYAEPLADGRYAVPLVGYHVLGYYRLEKQKNASGEDSNVLLEMPETDLARATHFRLDFNSRTLFHQEEKVDVYPANLFDGEWYYSSTVIASAAGSENAIGMENSVDDNFQQASRIKFTKSERLLRAVNVNVDDRLDKKDEVNYRTAIEIPVEWVEYRARKNGTDTDLSEEVVQTSKWSDRPYVKVAFGDARTPIDESEESKPVDIDIADGYFSFTVFKPKSAVRVKYSFLRAGERSYSPRRYFESDRKLFGYFTTVKSTFRNYELQRKEDFEKYVFLSRFNPNAKEIVYHFTSSSPQWVRSIGRLAVDEWNKAFKDAGSATEIKLDESKDVQLGDIRYNAINLVENLNDDGLGGFGPSLTDPNSGEIISATANIYVTSSVSQVTEDLRNYVKSQLGLFDAADVGLGSSALVSIGNTAPKKELLQDWQKMLAAKGRSYSEVMSTKALPKNVSTVDSVFSQVVPGNTLAEIKDKCPEVDDYIDELKQQKVAYNSREQAVLGDCAKKIALNQMAGSLLHEMGHNFGLRHNFHASNDADNFRSASETGTKEVVRTSSVMDYPGPGDDRPLRPGKYDIAAIRFGYLGKAETASNELAVLNTEKSIADNLAAQGKTLKPYKYCTDEDEMYGLDPMCAKWDTGVTPLEVVQNIIDRYNAMYTTMNFRYDRYRAPNPQMLSAYKVAMTFAPLKRFYDQWRFYLGQYVGLGKEYLEDMDKDSYAKTLKAMAQAPLFKEQYNAYYPASRKVFEFLTQTAMLPNRYCVVKANGGTDVVELEKVRDDIYRQSEISVSSCAEKSAAEYFKNKGATVVSEIGNPLNDMRYNLDIKKLDEPLDVIGTKFDRMFAFTTLVRRSEDSLLHKSKHFYPNFLDEPDLREQVSDLLLRRVITGLTIPELDPKKPFLKFEYEKDLLGLDMHLFESGNLVPGKDRLNANRRAAFSTYVTRLQEEVAKAPIVTQVGPYYVAALSEQNNIAGALIQKHRELLQISQIQEVSPNVFSGLNALAAQLPASSDAKNLTVGDFKAIMDAYASMIDQAPAEAKPHLAAVAGQELQLYSGLVPMLEQVSAQDPQKADKMLKSNLVQVLSQQGVKFTLYKDTIPARVNQYMQQAKAVAKLYRDNKADIDSQMDLIQSILLQGQN